MAQYDFLLTQNVASSGIQFEEKVLNLPNKSLLLGGANGALQVLPFPTSNEAGKVLKIVSGNIVWADEDDVTGLQGTTHISWGVDTDGHNLKIVALSASKFSLQVGAGSKADVEAKDATFDKVTLNNSPSANSDAATKAYVDAEIAAVLGANDAMVFKGTLGTGGTITSLPTSHDKGWTYKVISAATFAGKVCEVGDMIISIIEREGSGNTNDDWVVVQSNIDGAVVYKGAQTANRMVKLQGAGNELSIAAFSDSDVMLKSLFSAANSILKADASNTPSNLSINASNLVGRKSSGGIASLTAAEVRTIINVADGANNYVHPSGFSNKPTSATSGATIISQVQVNGDGHLTGVATRSLSLGDLGAMASWSSPPAANNSVGSAGSLAYDENYIYVCVGLNTWRRAALSRWL